MRYAVIADIHANLEALVAVLHATQSLDVDRLICLGDIVGYYTNPNECVDLIRRHAAACVRGNHDSVAAGLREPEEFSPLARRAIDWTIEHLTASNRMYLEDLPILQDIDDAFLIVHAALHPVPNDHQRIRGLDDALPSLEMLARGYAGRHLCFVGHMHQPAAYTLSRGEAARSESPAFSIDPDTACLVNPGSVGQSRDTDPRASILLYDSTRRSVQFHRIAYDCATAKQKAIDLGLMPRPHALRRSLRWLKRHLIPPDAAPAPHLSR